MKEIAEHLVNSGCYIKTNDDKFSTTYGDQVIAYLCCRLAISNVNVRKKIINELARIIYDNYGNKVTIAGMATAGIPWATGVAEKLDIPLLYLRSTPKEYGLKNLIEGNLKYVTDKVVIMDDVLYTGKTAQKGIEALSEKGMDVISISTLAKLSDKAEKKFNSDNIDVKYLTDYEEILDVALKEDILNNEEKNKMLRFYKNN